MGMISKKSACYILIMIFILSLCLFRNTAAQAETYVNSTNITVSKDYSCALSADSSSEWDNYATLSVTGNNSYGMYALNSSSVINSGDITTNGERSYGMVASDDSTATNFSNIVTSGDTSFGMVAQSSSGVTNAGNITTHGTDSYGMRATSGSDASNTGTITTTGSSASGMFAYGSGSSISNSGDIVTNGYSADGMWATTGASAVNTGAITTNGTYSCGVFANMGGTATNEGTITTTGTHGHGMYTYAGSVINSGDIETRGYEAYGILASSLAMYATATAVNSGDISTSGVQSHGMWASENSSVSNAGSIETSGGTAYGMYVTSGGTAVNTGTIETTGIYGRGMCAVSGDISNYGSISTTGYGAFGMYVHESGSTLVNSGDVTTSGQYAYGIFAYDNSSLINSGDVTTSGDGAYGMVIMGSSEGVNSGTVTATGAGAVYVDSSTFANSGTLYSALGNAVTALNGSTVTLLDGTGLTGSHSIYGDASSDLYISMSDDLSAKVVGFGTFSKDLAGTTTVEDGSWATDTVVEAGTLAVEEGGQFTTDTYTQSAGATLSLFADSGITPFNVSEDAVINGSVNLDLVGGNLPGVYTFMDTGSYTGDFETYFANSSGLYDLYAPQWTTEDSRSLYQGMVGYSFSEQALGLVAAINDWSMLRWVTANHLADVANGIENMDSGENQYYFHILGGKTERDPKGGSLAGFDATQAGVSIGFDRKAGDSNIWGLYAGYSTNDIDITDVAPAASDSEKQKSVHIGGYLLHRTGNWLISDALTYRKTDHDSYRKQEDDDATGDFDSWSVTNDIRAGYVLRDIDEDSRWQIIPEIGLNVGYLNRDGYSENNGFSYDDFDTTVCESVLGMRLRGDFARADGYNFSPQLRLSWVHVLDGDDVTLSQGYDGDWHSYTEDLDDDYFVADLGVSLYKTNRSELSLNYNGRFSDDSNSNGAWLRFKLTL